MLNGLTLDQVGNVTKILSVLRTFTKPFAVRVVFDEGMHGADYLLAIKALATIPGITIMGELCDSSAMKLYTLAQYQARANDFLKALGSYVHIWEIGNEINGDWLGAGAAQKALAAHNIFHAAGKKTALTGYYNYKCEDAHGPMQSWLQKNIDAKLKAEVNYFLISYYEDDCSNRIVSNTEWAATFVAMGTMFPNALLGMGECGTTVAANKVTCMKRYYTMPAATHPRFIGGFFWWYGYQDLIAKNTLVSTFQSLMR